MAVCSVASAHDGGLRTADDRVARLARNFDFQSCFILLSNKQSIYSDPDLTFHFSRSGSDFSLYSDLDPTFNFKNSDPDPAHHQRDAILLRALAFRPSMTPV